MTRTAFAYGLGGFAQNAVGTAIGVHLFVFYTDTVGLGPLWVSAGLTLALLWDAVSDVAMGRISDRTRSRYGRRRPYLLAGAIPSASPSRCSSARPRDSRARPWRPGSPGRSSRCSPRRRSPRCPSSR
jgi:MFS family permease